VQGTGSIKHFPLASEVIDEFQSNPNAVAIASV
jgi:hypothetical protein